MSIFSEVRECNGFWKSLWQTPFLYIWGCYPVYKEFFLPKRPLLSSRIVIRLFFKRHDLKGTRK